MKKRILFRADAGAEIGYGHFIRTLALADMLRDDFECVFYTQDPSEYQRKECEKVCKLVELPAGENRFQLFLDVLNAEDIVVLDNYFYTTEYQKAIKNKGCKLVCIDDMHDKHYVADVVINYGLVDLHDFSTEEYTRVCLGRDYLLLRRAFLDGNNKTERKKQVLLCFGGADPLRITDKITGLLLSLKVDKRIVVILGKDVFLSRDNRLKVQVLSNVSAEMIASLMRESELGIFSASTISYEGRSQHLPMLIGYYVDNQKEYFEKSVKLQGFVPLYDLRKVTKSQLKEALNFVSQINVDDYDYSLIPNRYVMLFNDLSNGVTQYYK